MAQEKFKFKSTETHHNLRLWLKPDSILHHDRRKFQCKRSEMLQNEGFSVKPHSIIQDG